ncbi:DUF2797 domain-containing protein [Saccharicrinis sp. FJH62]|uniref:DUF2797 domain-containing protein n=1 Tax=Saccharicrinis sp. FJH62 TaxID=3344657 RepID=UPI0035D421A5
MAEYILKKLDAQMGNPVSYSIGAAATLVRLNDLIGSEVEIVYKNKIVCSWCGKQTNKSFGQGYCYNCFVSCPETEECILRPELCKIQWGEARDLQWAADHHLQPHYVYLSFTSNFKVGVTRKTQVPTRWIDQGALAAMAVLEVPNRHIAGVVEDYMKQFFSDRTKWNEMLSIIYSDIYFSESYTMFLEQLPEEFNQYIIKDPQIQAITYPYQIVPNGLRNINLEKENTVKGTLAGIKGQYVVFKDGKAINIRKYTGYLVDLIF